MLGDLTFLHYAHMPHCKACVHKYFRNYYTLQYMTQGEVEVSYDKDVYQLKGNQFWPAFPGPLIQMQRAPGCESWEHRYIAFKGPLVSRWIADGLFPKTPKKAGKKNFTEDFDLLLKLLRHNDKLSHLKAINTLEKILLTIQETTEEKSIPAPWLKSAIIFLQKSLKESPDYEALARQLNMGLSTLRRNFKNETGLSLHLYTLQCKISEAKDKLGNTNIPIKKIAELLGYNDVYFFSRQFRKITGVPPGEYRKSRF
jgi:AraC-like DNA-binding protein